GSPRRRNRWRDDFHAGDDAGPPRGGCDRFDRRRFHAGLYRERQSICRNRARRADHRIVRPDPLRGVEPVSCLVPPRLSALAAAAHRHRRGVGSATEEPGLAPVEDRTTAYSVDPDIAVAATLA